MLIVTESHRIDRKRCLNVVQMLAATCKDRKSTRLNSSHLVISYAVFCLKKKTRELTEHPREHAVPLDLRQQRLGPYRTLPLPRHLPLDRVRAVALPVFADSPQLRRTYDP